MQTSQPPTFQNTEIESPYSPEGFLASLSPWQVSERERQMTVTSGRQCLTSFDRSGRLGLLVKMLLESPRWYSPVRSLKWKMKPLIKKRIIESSKPKNSDSSSTAFVKILSKRDIPSNRLLFRLAASVRPTNETGCGSLHDLMKQELLPTPVASDATMGAVIGKEDTFRITSTGMPRKVNRNGQDGSVGLARLVKLWDLLPTPTATDATRGGETVTGKSKQRANGLIFSATLSDLTVSGLLPTPVASDRNGGSTRTDPARQFSCALQDYVHGVAQQKDQSLIGRSSQLNPRFTLEMMGFPANWLDYPYHIKSGEPKP